MLSKVYAHRTNASRAARAAGLTKAPLIAVAGGYQFELPEGAKPSLGQRMIAAFEEGIEMVRAGAPTSVTTGWDTVEGGAKTVEEWEAAGNPWRHGCDPEKAAAIVEAADENEPDVPDARAAHTVVNGIKNFTVDVPVTPMQPAFAAAIVAADAARKPPRQRRAKAAKAVDKPKLIKTKRKDKAPLIDGATKRGTKAYADKMAARRRAGMNKRGITELVIKEIRTRWTPTSALLKMTGWQPTTLRGVLSLYAKKEGIEIKGETRDGERYYLVAR